jgi:hypothetical protein
LTWELKLIAIFLPMNKQKAPETAQMPFKGLLQAILMVHIPNMSSWLVPIDQ